MNKSLRGIAWVLMCAGVACESGTDRRPNGGVPAPTETSLDAPTEVAPAGPGRCETSKPGALVGAGKGASSSVALATANGRSIVLAADEDEKALHTIDARTLTELAVTPLDGKPKHLVVLSDGRVAVGLRDTARVAMFELGSTLEEPLEKRCDVEVAAEPWGLAESDGRLLVTSGYGGALTILDEANLSVVREIALGREPRGIVVDPKSKTAYVAHAVGGRVSAIDLEDATAVPVPIDLRAGARDRDDSSKPAEPREATQAYALASASSSASGGDGEGFRLLVPHTSVDPGSTGTIISGSGYGSSTVRQHIVAPIVATIDAAAKKSMNRSVPGISEAFPAQNCLLPRSAVVRGGSLFVACLDIDAVVEYDASLGDPSTVELRRFAVPAGPSSLALDASRGDLYVWSEFARSLTRVSLDDGVAHVASMTPWQRAGITRDARIERGRALFHTTRDARIAHDRACASCHPEGRDDGLVWTSPDGRRQTPMLAGRLGTTAPYGWFGENATIRDHVERTMGRLEGTGLSDSVGAADFDALLAYVGSLSLPERHARDGQLASRGEGVFASSGCGSCHASAGTDGHRHDVGSGIQGERHVDFDTPSLAGIGRSAPYFHDGRYATLTDFLDAKDSKMFDAKTLGPNERDALVAYLETL